MSSVTEFILCGYQLAATQREAVTRSWITASKNLGAKLPGSLLPVSIQRAGRLDAVLRCMEDEFASGTLGAEVTLWAGDSLVSFSEAWVGQVYEVLRLTVERKLIAESDCLAQLAHDFRLLRIPMEKHEIAADRSLSEPIPMSRSPEQEGDTVYHYDKNDLLRAHIMPSGISQRGSVQWLAVDVKANLTQRWIERRDLSERVLQFLGDQ
jgi:hypothetical protein